MIMGLFSSGQKASSGRWDDYAGECRDRAVQARGNGHPRLAAQCEQNAAAAGRKAQEARNEGR
jgi:hypothetical protein